jgi:hypothetical protein
MIKYVKCRSGLFFLFRTVFRNHFLSKIHQWTFVYWWIYWMLSVHRKCVLETGAMSATTVQCIKLLVRSKLVFNGIAVNEGWIRILLNAWNQILFQLLLLNAPLWHVQLLIGQYVFIAKSVNEVTYCDCNTVLTTDCSTVFVQFQFHKVLNKTMSYYNAVCGRCN